MSSVPNTSFLLATHQQSTCVLFFVNELCGYDNAVSFGSSAPISRLHSSVLLCFRSLYHFVDLFHKLVAVRPPDWSNVNLPVASSDIFLIARTLGASSIPFFICLVNAAPNVCAKLQHSDNDSVSQRTLWARSHDAPREPQSFDFHQLLLTATCLGPRTFLVSPIV